MATMKCFPLTLTHDGRKVPVKGFDWRNDCTNNPDIIRSWSTIYPQLKLLGVPTGSTNGIIALDVDVKKENGFETLKKYQVPKTMSQRTLSGGVHYIFSLPYDGKTYGNRVGFDAGLDIRGENGYVAFYNFDQTPLAPAPQWLLDVALKEDKPEIDLNHVVAVSSEIAHTILQDACEQVRNAPEGESNNVLNTQAYRVGQVLGSLDQDYAYNELFSAAKERGKPDYEAKATITSGLKGGAQHPFTSPFENVQPELTVPYQHDEPIDTRWTPRFFTKYDLTNTSKLRKPQLFRDWSTEDIHITTADGGTGKTTLKLVEAVHLALGLDFLGFKCNGAGRTLFVTGEDTQEKIGAMLGQILKQMNLIDDDEAVSTVMNSILVKKDEDLCMIDKTRNGFVTSNLEALRQVTEAIEDIRPRMIVFDPIASFWGSENLGNDMSKAVTKFLGQVLAKSNACVEAINHMGKQSSQGKDMTQFAGRGGTALPSHARVSRVLRPVFDEEYEEITGLPLEEGKTAMMCNVNKFSDGSPLYNKPFLIVRNGYLFERVVIEASKQVEEVTKMSDNERVIEFVREERKAGRYPNKKVVSSHFTSMRDKIPQTRVNNAIAMLSYVGYMGEKIKEVDNPDVEVGGKVLVVIDEEGKEI